MPKSKSERILITPSAYTKSHYSYVQETGTLLSLEPHISRREKLESFLFFIVLEGEGRTTLDGISFPLEKGNCVWIDCHHSYSHESSADHPWSLMWVHFYGNEVPYLYQLYLEKGGQPIFRPSSPASYSDKLTALYQLHAQKASLCDLLCHKHLTDMMTDIITDALSGKITQTIPQKFLDIKAYLEKHYREKLSLDILSKHFYISKFHLVREYQRLYNTTIMNELALIRLSHAKSGLRFDKDSIEQIALSCGFQTSAYFIKVFKRYENMTPLEYRKKW